MMRHGVVVAVVVVVSGRVGDEMFYAKDPEQKALLEAKFFPDPNNSFVYEKHEPPFVQILPGSLR